MERARNISHDSRLLAFLWTEAVAHANFLVNRSPTQANSGETPEGRFTGTTPDVSNLRIFGCIFHVHVPQEYRKKLDSKSIKCFFLGFDRETKAYRLFDQSKKKIILSRDVVFDESKVGYHHLNFIEPPSEPIDFSELSTRTQDTDQSTEEGPSIEIEESASDNLLDIEPPIVDEPPQTHAEDAANSLPSQPCPEPLIRRYPTRNRSHLAE